MMLLNDDHDAMIIFEGANIVHVPSALPVTYSIIVIPSLQVSRVTAAFATCLTPIGSGSTAFIDAGFTPNLEPFCIIESSRQFPNSILLKSWKSKHSYKM